MILTWAAGEIDDVFGAKINGSLAFGLLSGEFSFDAFDGIKISLIDGVADSFGELDDVISRRFGARLSDDLLSFGVTASLLDLLLSFELSDFEFGLGAGDARPSRSAIQMQKAVLPWLMPSLTLAETLLENWERFWMIVMASALDITALVFSIVTVSIRA